MKGSFRIGDWVVEPLQNRLVRGDTPVKLDPKVMQVLLYLAERPNEVAEKEKIISTVWEGTFVTDEVLTNAIFELRKALGDDAKEPRFIQTVPRKGYRLLVSVEAPPVERRRTKGAWIALACFGIVAIAAWYLARTETPAPQSRVTPLTGFPGAEWWPALSPEGERVAFVWDGGKPGPFDLYVQMIGGGAPLRLTKTSAHEYSPAWSPDGNQIAFLREDERSEVLIVPALGGPERRLTTITTRDLPGGGWYPGLAWSPGGKFLAIVDRESSAEPHSIFLFSTESGEKRRITSPPSSVSRQFGDNQPAFSPDGLVLAFARERGATESQILLQPLVGGEPALVATPEGYVTDLDWTADRSAIVFGTGSEAQAGTSLFRVNVSGGIPERLGFGEMAHTISMARSGTRMVYDRRSWIDADLWRIDGPAAKEPGSPTRLFSSSRLDWAPEYSPDGTKVAFASERSGSNNIWICGSEGTDCLQLTHGVRAIHPSWSPDGKHLVFSDLDESSHSHLFIAEIEEGFTRRLTSGDSYDAVPDWSRDGKWIYFQSNRTGEMQIWKIPAEGGEAIQLTRNGGIRPRESSDGRFVYYADRPGRCNLRRVPVDGGGELPLMAGHEIASSPWTLHGNQVIHESYEENEQANHHVDVFDLDTGQTKRIFSTELRLYAGMTVSPDGRWVLLSMAEPNESDIMLVEGFR